MKKISLVVDEVFLNNKIFDKNDTVLNFDNFLAYMRYLKSELAKIGYDISTYDINTIEESDLIFYFEINNKCRLPQTTIEIQKSYLFIWECQIITPNVYQQEYHKLFNKIFTFRDDLIDNKKYFKINYSFDIPQVINYNSAAQKKLCTLIAGNKVSRHKLELYSKRLEAINWFEQNAPDDFDFYGRGWDKFISSNRIIRKFCNTSNLFNNLITKMIFKPSKLYKGEVTNKIDTLQNYKFCICYENARDIPGYITEKIFHSFFAGCIPIYWGANNITDHIPASCFIDKRKYTTYYELYTYLRDMSDDIYLTYIKNIQDFLQSNKAWQFSSECFMLQVKKVSIA